MKIIMLDFDGVLVTARSIKNKDIEVKADPACVAALNRMMAETGAQIVVSSTWRAAGVAKVREWLVLWGVEGKLFGLTPDLSVMYHGGLWALSRASEIALWLAHCPVEVESMVILDDDKVEVLGWPLVQTDFESGLTDAHADRAIQFLNKWENSLGGSV